MNIPEFKSSFLSQNWHNGVPKIKSKRIFLWWPIIEPWIFWVTHMVNYDFQRLFGTLNIYVFKSGNYTKRTLKKRVIWVTLRLVILELKPGAIQKP